MLAKPDAKSSQRRRKYVPEWQKRRREEVAPMTKAQWAAYQAVAAQVEAKRELHRDDPIPF